MADKENTDELVVVDANRYNKVKKALVESLAGDKGTVPPSSDEKENTRELVVVDVKRYKKVKKALEASEERYRQLFENVPIGIYRTTPDGRIIDSNPALVAMLGYGSFAELATRNLAKDPRHPSYPRADFIQLLERDGEVKGLESVWKKRDGSLLHIRENAKLVRSDDGQVFYEGTVEDITQSKLAEEAQRTRTQQIEILNCIITQGNLAESLGDMLEVILDCAIEPLAFDVAAIFMYDLEKRKGRLVAQRGMPQRFVFNEEYLSVDHEPFSRVMVQGQPYFVDDTQRNHPYYFKKWGWRMACSVPLVSKGRVIGALNAASHKRIAFRPEEKSILEMIGKEAGTLVSKLQTETALRDSEKYYRTLIDTSPDIIVVMDLDATIITANQRFLKTGSYSYDEVIGKSTFEFVSGLERFFLSRKTAEFIKRKSVSGSEYLFKKKDGQAIPLEVSASVLVDDEGEPTGIIAIGRDISERKQAELKIAEKNKMLAILNQISLELAGMPPADDINDYISRKLKDITQAIYVGVNRYNKDTRQLEFVSANTASKVMNKVTGILGRKVDDFRFDVSEATYKEIVSEIVGYRNTLHEASFGAIPETASSLIHRLFRIDRLIGMALVAEGELIGTAIMVLVEGTPAVSEELLKSFSHIVSVSLRRRQAEFQLAASEEKFKKLFYISPDSILVSRLDDGRIVSVNKGFSKILGYGESEVIGQTYSEIGIFKNPEELLIIVDILRTRGVAENIECWFVSKSGKHTLGLLSAAILDINGEKFAMATIRDISERKRAEDALRDSEEKFRSIAEQTSDLIAITGADGVITYASSASASMFRCPPEKMCGRRFVEFLDAPSVPKALAAFRADQERGGRTINLELAMKRGDGSVFAGELSGSSFHYGTQYGSLVVIRDIDHRKRAEEQLRFLGSITENTSDAIMVTDLNFTITYINKVAEQFFGYTLAELKGATPEIFNADPRAAQIQKRLYRTVAAGKSYLGESLNRRKDGSTFFCEYKVMPLRDAAGKIYAYFSVQRDISERKRSEEELRQSEDTFRRTFEAIPDPAYIWTRQPDGRITLSKFNQAAMKITQGMIKDYEGVEAKNLFADHPDYVKRIVLAMDKGKRQFDETLYTYHSTGRSRWLQTDYVRTAEDNVMVITKDVSERKEAEVKLLAYQEQLRALTSELFLIEEKERRRIASELHDQIGQNLALCKLKVAALEKDTTHGQEKSELSGVRRLLECSIQDTRSLIFDLSPPVLYELGFQAALEWLAERIEDQYHVPVEFENRAGEGGLGNDLQVILFQVVRELLVNVGKHSRASQAKVILSQEDQFLKIQVNDDGVGFDASQIFDAKGHPGSYGFFSMRERLNYLGGALEVKSRPGQGSQVVLTVPREVAAKGEKP